MHSGGWEELRRVQRDGAAAILFASQPMVAMRVLEGMPGSSEPVGSEPGRELPPDGLAVVAGSILAVVAHAQGHRRGYESIEAGLDDQAVPVDRIADDQERIAARDELVDGRRHNIAEGVPPAEQRIALETAVLREIAREAHP